jgi:sulfate permease, SulP family
MALHNLTGFLPIFEWLPNYQRAALPGDIMAGVIVTIVLIPQAMAYAMLAGLPPQLGLYSCVLPIILYSALGSSRVLAIGPVGLMSLMTAEILAEMNPASRAEMILIGTTLALLAGIVLLTMRLVRFGAILNFLSHPVISGFTSASAILIAFSQLKHLLGLDMPRGLNLFEIIAFVARNSTLINWMAAIIGVVSILIILWLRGPLNHLLARLRLPAPLVNSIGKTGPLCVVVLSILITRQFALDQQSALAIVGAIPKGLPTLAMPPVDWPFWKELLPGALLIAVIGFLESVSVGKALASRKRQKIDANQELLGLGAANLGAAFSGGYPVAGGFGRSMVNFSSGANTPLASLITAGLMALSLMFLTPFLYYLPRTTLAAIIIVAVAGLIDFKTLRHTWNYDKADATSLIATFIAVLTAGLEPGIAFGAALSIALYLHRSSEPHMAIVGRVDDTEHFRNVERHPVTTYPHILALRIDENLYFANTNYLEDKIMNLVVDNKDVDHVVLVCSSISFIDSSALESLEMIIERLRNAGVTLHFAEIKGPVMDHLGKTDFLSRLGDGKVFLSIHEAIEYLHKKSKEHGQKTAP